MTPEELDARYDGDVARFAETIDLSAEEWTAGRAREDLSRWGVGAAVRHDGRVLLVRQRDRWMLPGGMLEPGETFPFAFAAFLARPEHTRIAADGLPGEDIEAVAWHASLPEDTFQREVVGTLVEW